MGKRARALIFVATLVVAMIASPRPALAVGDITGTVTDNSSGEPIRDVTVTLYDLNENVIATGVTGPDGTYAFLDLADGDYVLKFEKTGYLTEYFGTYYTFAESRDSSWVSVPVGFGGMDESLDTDAVSGTVTDSSTGDPIDGVTVTLYDLAENVIGADTTDANGEYAIAAGADGAGDYVLKFEKAGYLTEYYGTYYAFAESRDSNWVTLPGASGSDEDLESDAVTGTVYDHDSGSALEGATVTLYDLDGNAVGSDTTDANGEYSIATGEGGVGDYVVGFAASGYVTEYYGDWYTFTESRDNNWISVPGASGTDANLGSDAVTGTVYDPDSGSAFEGAVVVVYDLNEVEVGRDTTDASGEYSIPTGEDAANYVVWFSAVGYISQFLGGWDNFEQSRDNNWVTVPGASGVDQTLTLGEPQAIDFGVLEDRTLDQSPFDVDGSATSGLLVTFGSLTVGVCTLAGATVTLVAEGTCTIRASQGGDTTWGVAANVDRGFTVAAAPTPTPTPTPSPIPPPSDDDAAPVPLPLDAEPDADPLVIIGRAVMLPVTGLVTRALQLVTGDVKLDIPAGVTVLVNGQAGPVVLYPPVQNADPTSPGFRFSTSMGDEVTFSPPITATLTLPASQAGIRSAASSPPPLYVPVRLGNGGAYTCLSGTESAGAVRFSVDRGGSYALRGPERPAVVNFASSVRALPGLHSRWAGQSVTSVACAGQLIDATVLLQNVGTGSWIHGTRTQVVLGSNAAPGSTRDFEAGVLHAPLYNRDRFATTVESRVDPGQTGTFAFRIRAPSTAGAYRVYLRPVVEGVAWLEDEGIYLELEVR